jgi:hypothetical protein
MGKQCRSRLPRGAAELFVPLQAIWELVAARVRGFVVWRIGPAADIVAGQRTQEIDEFTHLLFGEHQSHRISASKRRRRIVTRRTTDRPVCREPFIEKRRPPELYGFR